MTQGEKKATFFKAEKAMSIGTNQDYHYFEKITTTDLPQQLTKER